MSAIGGRIHRLRSWSGDPGQIVTSIHGQWFIIVERLNINANGLNPMKKTILILAAAFGVCLVTDTNLVQAQCASCETAAVDSTSYVETDCGPEGCLGKLGGRDNSVRDADGMIQPTTTRRISPRETLKYGVQDHFSPRRFYPYTNAGMAAGHTHSWMQQQATATPWHGGYSHWRWGTPTALVVPPNSSYGTNYAWGVGQTTSTPLYHQFGRGNSGVVYGAGFGMSPSAPYYPSSTNQFGIYSVRAPW